MVIGFVFLILYHFILRPADPDNPLVIALFYFFLPAILLAAGGLLDVILEELPGILNRFREKDEEIQDEDAWS
jgi:hypothetical protein